MWKCAKCGKDNNDDRDHCWSCSTNKYHSGTSENPENPGAGGLLQEESMDLKLGELTEMWDRGPGDGTLAKELANFGKKAVDPILTLLPELEGAQLSTAVTALAKIGETRAGCAIHEILKSRRSFDFDEGVDMIRALGKLGEKDAVDTLLELLKDQKSTPNIRQAAAVALGDIGEKRAIPVLVGVLREKGIMNIIKEGAAQGLKNLEWQPEKDEQALALVGKLKAEGNIKGLIDGLMNKDPDVQKASVTALKQFDDREVAELVLGALVEISRKGGYAEDIVSLQQMLLERENAAIGLLLSIFQGGDLEAHYAAWDVLVKIGGAQLIDTFIIGLKDDSQSIRSDAARALGEIHNERVVEPLMAALQDGDMNVRLQALSALGGSGDARAVPSLIAILKAGQSYSRELAARALGSIGDARAVEPLTFACHTDDIGDVRAAAAQALQRISSKRTP